MRHAATGRGIGFILLALALTLLPPPPPSAAGEDPAPAEVYVRARRSIAETVAWLEQEATRIEATQVVVAFDAATFDPPPGLSEFTLEYPFFEDLPAWLEALEGWAGRASCMLRGTSSLVPKTIDLKPPGATRRLETLIRSRWWEGERPAALPSAARWMADALARTENAVRAEDATPTRMLVLIASSVTPERWVRADADKGYESEWRTKLPDVGDYLREGAAAAALERARCRLYVVAPEARFGDFTPYVEMPELPWAARPHLPGDDLRLRIGQMGAGLRGGRGAAGTRRALDRMLRDSIPDPEARRKAIDEMLRRVPETPVPPTSPSPRAPGITTLHDGGLRFLSSTPVWFRMLGGTVPFNNHAPSGYGIWPYARVAARTGGRYVFYPFPSARWLDTCPADGALINRLAPELVSRRAYLAARKGDHALGALARAAALVFDDTPWSDTWPQHRAARSWTSFTRTAPLRLERKVWLRRRPYDDALQGSERGIERVGVRIQEEVLPRYEKALAVLERAVRQCKPGVDGVHPRSHANLLLARYWFHMSAFHLEAYSIYAREIQRFIPPEMKGHVDRIVVTYVPTIRMSDCLDAYDGRELALADEGRYERWAPRPALGYQGNILDVPVENPDFRARRNQGSVLRFLDKRLHRRALRMITAARAVMRTYGRTGWGWSVYYSDAYSFLFLPVEVRRGHQPSRGGGKSPPRPTTPRGGGPGKGGSSAGGPATGK